MTTAVTVSQVKTVPDVLALRQDQILACLPDQVARERFWHIAAAVFMSTDLSRCSEASKIAAIYGCSRLGLIPDKALGHVWILPYKTVAQVIVGYKGYIELARRSRSIGSVQAEVVHANDVCEVHYGTVRRIEHRPWFDIGADKPGEPRFAYATWYDIQTSMHEFRVSTLDRIDRAKKASKAASKGSGPWISDELAMWKRTAIIEASKMWPQSPEIGMAVRWDEQAERGEPQDIPLDEMPTGDTEPQLLSLDDDPPEEANQDLEAENAKIIAEETAQAEADQ